MCSDASQDQFYGQNIYHTDHIQRASHCNVLSDVSQEYFYQQNTYYTVHI